MRYERAERFAGATKYPLRKMLRFSLDAITGFSYVPLQLATIFGFVLAGISLLAIVVAAALRLATEAIVGHLVQRNRQVQGAPPWPGGGQIPALSERSRTSSGPLAPRSRRTQARPLGWKLDVREVSPRGWGRRTSRRGKDDTMLNTYNEAVLGAPPVARTMARARGRALTVAPHRLALGAILLLAATLNLWRLGSIGYANSYYAAAVKSMLLSWHNFFFVSFDPGGFVSIDKPPLGFWIQTASAKLLGYSGTSLLLPEAIAGVLSVAVLYRVVGRVWGRGAGLLAALFLAVTPVAVIDSRNNTIDSLLVLAVLLGAWAAARAAESGRLRWLLLAATLVGLGFNIKMLEAYLVVPAFGLVYLLGAHTGWRTRIVHLAAAAATLLAVSLSWAIAVDLTPAASRPYVGSSGTNSALNLALGYNGLQRLLGGSGTPGGGSGSTGLFGGGPASPFRLLGTTLGGQVGWLLILAALGLIVAALSVPWRGLDGRGRSLLLWGGWLLTAGGFFSVASFFHPYYTVMLAPAIAALGAIGVTVLWRAYQTRGRLGWLLPLVLLDTAAVQAYILRDYPDWSRWLTPLAVGGCMVAALALVAARLRPRRATGAILVAAGLAVASLLAAPTAWAAYSVTHTVSAGIPTAGPSAQASGGMAMGAGGGQGGTGGGPGGVAGGGRPSGPPPGGMPSGGAPGAVPTNGVIPAATVGGATRPTAAGTGAQGGGPGGDQVDSALLRYLEAHRGTTRYLVATASSNGAASIIISAGRPVMALGGFSGNDAILTTAGLAKLIAGDQVHYFLVQSGGMGGNSALMQWVVAHGKAVPASQYETTSVMGGSSLYYVSSAAANK